MAPKKDPAAYLRMAFATNSLRNTTVSVDDDTLYYEIVTRFWHPHLTKIFKLDVDMREMVLVAEIERVPGNNVRVRFGGEGAEWVDELDFLSWDLEKRWASHVFALRLLVPYWDDDQRRRVHRRRRRGVQMEEPQTAPSGNRTPSHMSSTFDDDTHRMNAARADK
jgi:hypothetical protein